MTKQKSIIDDAGIDEAECFECGIKLRPEETADVDGDTLCDQCAEDYLREMEPHEAQASPDDDAPSDLAVRLH